jgi:NAD(P)-dependent dehydrogenase (short-subunit alcohol dehydrogenase family)
MRKLEGRTAVITGGNSGIGAAIALDLEQQGASVVIFGRNAETLEATKSRLNGKSLAVQGDVAKLADLDRLFAEVKRSHDKIDVLVVNAGIAPFAPLDQVDEKLFDALTDVNFKGAFFTVQKALPILNDGASIVVVSSVAGNKGYANTSVYSATKAAVRSLVRTLAAELAPRGIRVNTLSPGPIDTPIFHKTGVPAEQVGDLKRTFASQVPLQRLGTVEEMASAARFLASDDSSYITGADLAADGGLAQV